MAWDQEGHSIVAEIAQKRLQPDAADAVTKLLGGRSLASVASWADDVRDNWPDTYNWHFVDIPIHEDHYTPERDCAASTQGDCIVQELTRLRTELRCGVHKDEALKFAVHFVGDIHQPLHTVLEARGGNDIPVALTMRGRKSCKGECKPVPPVSNFHAAWDSGMIRQTVWAWGGYVDVLEDAWLTSAEAKQPDLDGGTPEAWAEETHKVAQKMWALLAAKAALDDEYYKQAVPIIDRQLAVGGLRLARFLNEAYASKAACPAQ
jgi:hypothetical protein